MADLGQLLITLGVNTAALNKAAVDMDAFRRNTENAMTLSANSVQKNWHNTMTRVGYDFQRFGATAAVFLTAPLILMSKQALTTATDLDYLSKKTEALTGVSSQQMETWNTQIKRISNETARSQKELADALYFISSPSLRGAVTMDILEASARAATIGLGKTNDIAKLLVYSINAYGRENLSAAKATDILVTSVREGVMEATDMVGQIGKVIPVARLLGVGFGEVAGAIAAMTKTGMNTATASTALRQILVTFLGPTKGATTAIEETNSSFVKLRNTLRSGHILPVLKEIDDSMKSTGNNMHEVFGNIRALTGGLSLLGASYEQNLRLMDAVNNSTGEAAKAYKIMTGTIRFELEKAVNALSMAWADLGKSMSSSYVKILQNFTEKIKDLTAWWNALSNTTQKSIVIFGAFIAALAPLALILTFAMRAVIAFSYFGGLMSKVVVGMSTAFNYLTVAIASNPIGALATLLVSIGVLWISYDNSASKAAEAQIKVNEAVMVGKALMNDTSSIERRMSAIDKMTRSELETFLSSISTQMDIEEKYTVSLQAQLEQRYLDSITFIEKTQKVWLSFMSYLNGISEWVITQIGGTLASLKDLFDGTGSFYRKFLAQLKGVNTDIVDNDKKTGDTVLKQQIEASKKRVAALQTYGKELANAIANLTDPVTGLEIDKGKGSADIKKKVKEIMDALNESLKRTSELSKLFNRDISTGAITFDTSKDPIKAYAKAIEDLIPILGRGSKEVKALVLEFRKLFEVDLSKPWDATKRFQTFGVPNPSGKNLLISNKIGILDQPLPYDLKMPMTAQGTPTGLMDPTAGWNVMLGHAKNEQIVADTKKWREEVRNIAKAYQAVGQAFNSMISSYVSLITARQQKAYDFIDKIAKREHKSAEWVAKQKEKIDAEYGRKKKAAAIAEAIINTAVAVTSALKAGPIVGIILAALTAAAGAVQIATIQSTPMARGGVVPAGYPNDSYPARLTSGETVIPPGRLPEFTGGGLNPITIHLTGKLLAEGNDLVYVMDKQITINRSY